MNTKIVLAVSLLSAACLAPAQASEFTLAKPSETNVEYSPFINQSFPQRVYWGDTHLHTTYSPDAGMIGNFKLGPEEKGSVVNLLLNLSQSLQDGITLITGYQPLFGQHSGMGFGAHDIVAVEPPVVTDRLGIGLNRGSCFFRKAAAPELARSVS